MNDLTAEDLIDLLGLQPLAIEGGYFRETYRSRVSATLGPYASERSIATAIYYLHAHDTVSAMHRLPGDEVYHFYYGDAVELLVLRPDGTSEVVLLGNDFTKGERPQHVVAAGTWQGSRLANGGTVALLGTTMSPGFDYLDFRAGDRDELVHQYPDRKELIEALTNASTKPEWIYHFLPRARYQIALERGHHEPESLDKEGFVHCSTKEQVVHVANFIARGARDLVLLKLDPQKIAQPILFENLEGGERLFPHVYGPLPIRAVETVIPFQPDETGEFREELVEW